MRPTFQPEARAADRDRPVREAPAARRAADREPGGGPAQAATWGPKREEDWEDDQRQEKRRRDRRSREDQEPPRAQCPTTLSEASTTASVLGADEIQLRDHRIAKLEQVRKYAFAHQDLGVLARFLELTFDRLRPPPRAGALASERPEPPLVAMKLVLRAMKLLHLCDYGHEDVCVLLAHTSLYFKKTFSLCGSHMDRHEVANALVLLLFVAHSYLLDETCPLNVWHQHLFAKYCSMRTLNAAVFRLLDIRGFRLKLDRKDVDKRFAFLKGEGEPPPPTPQVPVARPRDGPLALAPTSKLPG